MKKLMLLLGACAAMTACADDAQSWRYFAADAEGNPHAGTACITNGTGWALAVSIANANTTKLRVTRQNASTSAFLSDPAALDTLDLRGAVTDAAGTAYRIVSLGEYSLGPDATRSTPKVFISPGTLTWAFEACFASAITDADGNTITPGVANYTHITIDEPNQTDRLCGSLLPNVNFAALRLTLHLPKVKRIEDNALTSTKNGSVGKTNIRGTFTSDSLASVTWIGGNGMSNRGFDGVLHLPVLEGVDSWAANGNDPGFYEVFAGAEARSVRQLDRGAFGWLNNLTNVVLGLAEGNTIASQVFSGNNKLKKVEFTGAPPNFKADAKDFITGPAEKAVTIIVPPTAAWEAYLAPFEASGDFVRWSAEEIAAARAANPTGPIVIGTVSGSVFCMQRTQLLAVSDRVSLWTGLEGGDAAYGDAVDATFVPDATAPLGVALRLTARAGARGTFAGWYGDVPDGKTLEPTLTLRTADSTCWRFARFTHPWTLTREGNAATLDDGVFRIQATVSDTKLTLGRGSACSLYAADNTGSGVLDLGGAITDAAGTAYRIAEFNGNSSLSSSKNDAIPGARVFVSPGTLAMGNWSQFFHATGRRPTYETIIFDEPTLTGAPQAWCFSEQTNLKYIIFRCPKMDFSVDFNGMLYHSQIGATDVGWWKLDGVKTFGTAGSLGYDDGWTKARLRGELRLPAVTKIGTNALRSHALGGAWLGVGDKKNQVTSIGANAFKLSGISNLVINAAADLAVGENAFADTPNLKTVTYLGPVVNETAFAAILASATAATDGTKPVVVYASAQQGWDKAEYLDTPTEDELAFAPAGEHVLGVYRGGAEAPAGLAWVCHKASPFDPKSTVFLLR